MMRRWTDCWELVELQPCECRQSCMRQLITLPARRAVPLTQVLLLLLLAACTSCTVWARTWAAAWARAAQLRCAHDDRLSCVQRPQLPPGADLAGSTDGGADSLPCSRLLSECAAAGVGDAGGAMHCCVRCFSASMRDRCCALCAQMEALLPALAELVDLCMATAVEGQEALEQVGHLVSARKLAVDYNPGKEPKRSLVKAAAAGCGGGRGRGAGCGRAAAGAAPQGERVRDGCIQLAGQP